MSIDNYGQLVTAVGDWLDRGDLSARIPDFIRLTEARLNRLLEDPDMETSVTLTGDGATLPADFGQMVSIGTADDNPLAQMGAEEYAAILPFSGTTRYYTIRENKIYYTPGAANPTLVYRRTIPALTATNTTNWLLERAPDVYLYGALVHAEAYLDEDDRLPLWKQALDEAIDELRADGSKRRWGVGPIAPRIKRA